MIIFIVLQSASNYNMAIVIGALGTVTKSLVKGLEDLEIRRVETIQTPALLRLAKIPRRVLETCCHSNSNEKPSANTDLINSQGVKILIQYKQLLGNLHQ